MRNSEGEKYVIVMARGCGLFSLFTQVLTVPEAFPDRRIAVLFNALCPYWTPDGRNGSRNAWEYYFEPLSDKGAADMLGIDDARLMYAGVEDVRKLAGGDRIAVVNTHQTTRTVFYGRFFESDRHHVKGIIDRHIRVKPPILGQAEAFFDGHMAGKDVVGLHYRGTDKYRELAGFLPHLGSERPIGAYLDAVDRVAPGALVYMATDSQPALEAARERLGKRLVCQEGWTRSADGRPLHYAAANRAKQGEEAVVDWLLLSRCGFLVHGVSSLSAAVLFAAPDLPHLDVYGSLRCA